MNRFIEKNILIDDLLELEIMYMPEIFEIFNKLRNIDNIDNDIELFYRILCIIDSNILETEEYLKSISISLDNLEFENNYISNNLNDLYISKHKIETFINKINKVDNMLNLQFNLMSLK
jgi:hypothetical protein